MSTVTASCELMDNAFPAGPLQLSGKFFVVEDHGGEHMLFSIDRDRRLCLILKDDKGNNMFVNLSEKFGVPDQKAVTALAVNQNKDLIIHLVFAVRQDDGTCRLCVVEPLKPGKDIWVTQKSLSNRLYSGTQWNIEIENFLIGSSNDGLRSYPQLHLVYRHLGRKTVDLRTVQVECVTRSWVQQNDFELPRNEEHILDACPGNIRQYRGLFVLSKLNGKAKLSFSAMNQNKKDATIQAFDINPVPDGATTIATLLNKDGFTDLLVSGAALTLISGKDILSENSDRQTIISQDPIVTRLEQMYLAQTEDNLSIWGLSKSGILGYQEFAIPAEKVPVSLTPGIKLLENIHGEGRIAALQNHKLGQKIFVIDDSSTIKMLEQSTQTGLWQPPVDIMIPQSDKMITFSSYTIEVGLKDEQNVPRHRKEVKIMSSTSAELIVNGSSVRGSPEGKIIKTDDAGAICIIVRNEGLSAPILTLCDAHPGDNIFPQKTYTIDPMNKIWGQVEKMNSADALKKLEMPDGSKFVKAGVPDLELEKAANALQKLIKAKKDLAGEEKVQSQQSDIHVFGQSANDNRLWGLWYFVRDKIESGFDWFVEKVGEAWEFAVEIGGKLWKLLIQNLPQVAAAIESILSAISKGWDWIKDQLGFIFNWSEILAVKNVFVNTVTQGFLYAADGASLLEREAAGTFREMREKIKMLRTLDLPGNLKDIRAGLNPEIQKEAGDRAGSDNRMNDLLNSPQGRYGINHMRNGESSLNRKEGETLWDRIKSRFQDTWKQLENLVTRLATNIAEALVKGNMTLAEFLEKVGWDMFEDLLSVLEKIITGILGTLSDILVDLADYINDPISIPVLSPLYKSLTGNQLTILDACCLVIAIPTTLLYKVVMEKSPTQIEGIGPMTQPNAFREELDERMGRIKEGAEMQSSSTKSAALPDTFTTQSTAPITASERQFLPSPGTPFAANTISSRRMVGPLKSQAFSPDNSGVHKASATDQKHERERNLLEKRRRRFQSSVPQSLIKFASGVTSVAVYNLSTFPKIFVTDAGITKTTYVSAVFKLLQSTFQFIGLNLFESVSEDIPGTVPKFLTWGVGVFTAFAGFLGKELGAAFGAGMYQLQFWLWVWHLVEVCVKEKGYSVYVAVEDFLKVTGKVLTCAVTLANGTEPYSTGLASILSNASFQMYFWRIVLEGNDGKKKIKDTVLYGGMDMGC